MQQLFNLYLKNRKLAGLEIVNETKFLKIVQFWFGYFELIDDFISQNNKDFALLNNPIINKSILYSFDVLEKKNNSYIPNVNKVKQSILGNFSFGKKGILPGGLSNSISEKIQFKLLYYKLDKLHIEINQNFKINFYNDCLNHFDHQIVDLFKLIIPEIFFSYEFKSTFKLPTNLKGSPLSFLDFNYNYIKLLLQPINIEITGIQHGGYYGEWTDNPYEVYEKSISDIYYGWGFFDRNIVQNRFKKKLYKFRKSEGIFWFGRHSGYLPKRIKFGNNYCLHNYDVNHIEFFNSFFEKFSFKFLPHPSTNPSIYSKIISNTNFVYTSNSIQYVANAKLIVFDCLSHTLMYYCLYNKLPFIIVLDKWPITGLSISALEFYN
jgi:hypothetical protein